MGIRREEDGTYTVWYAKRHPITRRPYNMRRTKIKTKAEAHGVYDQLVIKLHEKFQKNISPLWTDVANEFFEDYLNRGIKKSTVSNYKQSIKAHIFKKWKGREISSINTDEIRKLITEDLADRTDPTKKSILKYIRAVFNFALEKNIIGRNPVPKMQFKRNEKIKKVLNESELRIFLQKAKAYNHEWFSIWAVACYTGLRNGELFALRWENVSLESRIMVIKESWSKLDGFKETKSGDDRIVEISKDIIPILESLQTGGSEYVFPRIPEWIKGEQARVLRHFLTGIGLPTIRFHDLRASWATVMLSKGIEPIKVMSMGGWKDLKTMQIYIRKSGINIQGITDAINLLSTEGLI